MTPAASFPTEQERQGFVEKIVQFRSTLSPGEQQLLDTIARRAYDSQAAGDVQAYGLLDHMPDISALLSSLLEELGKSGLVVNESGEVIGHLPPMTM